MGRPKGSKNKSKQLVQEAPIKPVIETIVTKPLEPEKVVEVEKPKVTVPIDKETQKAINKRLAEINKTMEKFTKDIKPDDSAIISKWMSYISTPCSDLPW